MINFLINWLISGIAIMIASYLLPGIRLSGFAAAMIAAVVFGFINAFIKPVLSLLTLPLTIMTLGLFSLVINSLLVLLVSRLVNGFQVASFWWALAFSLLLALVNFVLGIFRP